MTSAVLQWIALLTMVIDHVGYAFFPQLHFLRSIGRISFPIFAFLLAEGFLHTSNRKNYALRLAVFAVVSEIPYELFFYGRLGGVFPMKNILFALLLSLGALWCVEQGGAWLLGAAAAILGAQLGGFSYGAYGVLLAVCFYLCRNKRWAGAVSLAACTGLYCILRQSAFQSWAVLAAVPLLLYNGKRGKRPPRYLLYVFYPVHMGLIFLARCWLRGW